INIASAVVSLLADELAPSAAAALPTRRTAALVEAVRGLPEERTDGGDHRYVLAGTGSVSHAVRLDEIPLPAGTPRPRRVAPLPGWR
nr:hypothetical protein [Micromonospora sp. DSM 115978]